MEDFVFRNKRMYNSVTALWLNVITWIEVVIVRGNISIKGSLSCMSSRINHWQLLGDEIIFFTQSWVHLLGPYISTEYVLVCGKAILQPQS